MKRATKLLIMLSLTTWMTACFSDAETKFTSNVPIKKIVAVTEHQFPQNSFYRSTPIENVIVATKDEFGKSKISAYDKSNGKQLWQTNFEAFYVGQTDKNILLYDSHNVLFVNPKSGEITRKASNIPNPIKTSFDFNTWVIDGMAFTEDYYISTKALYTQIYADEKTVDETFQIGITAKNWEKNEKLWFVPPVKQIVSIKYKPVIFDDKTLIVNPPQTIDGKQTYQIISIKTGNEIYRGNTEGKYFLLGENILIEETSNKISRINFAENKSSWSIENSQIIGTNISAISNQITVSKLNTDGTRNVKILDAETGNQLKKFDLPNLSGGILDACYLMKDGKIVLHFFKDKTVDRNHDYFVGWNSEEKKALWRTDFNWKTVSSLFNLIGEKLKVEN